MAFPDLAADIAQQMPELRGRLTANAPLADITWFRAGGPAQLLYTPADEPDLAYFMRHRGPLAVTVIGVGSNLLVRDGGIPGVVIRLGRGFSGIQIVDGTCIRVGAAVPDMRLAQAAAKLGIGRLSFYRGIPGTVGGALRMNAGAHGGETQGRCWWKPAPWTAGGRVHVFSNADMQFTYRHCGVPADFIFTEALFQGEAGDPAILEREMEDVAAYREANQPTKAAPAVRPSRTRPATAPGS